MWVFDHVILKLFKRLEGKGLTYESGNYGYKD